MKFYSGTTSRKKWAALLAFLAASPAGCTRSTPAANPDGAGLTPVAVSPTPISKNAAALFKAIQTRDLAQVQSLVKADSQILKAEGPLGTALHRSSNGPGDAEITKYLLDSGADVNARDEQGNTPLNVAVRGRGNPEKTRIVDLLLSGGADANAPTRGGHSTPLHIAAFAGNVDVVKLLLAHDAKVSALDKQGKTALQILEGMQQKLDAGDKNTQAISKIFDMKNYPAIIQLLRKA